MTEQIKNSWEDEDFRQIVQEIEDMDAEVETIMASARGKASKIREAQKRKKKMAKQELGIQTEILNATLKTRKLERQLEVIAQSIPEEMAELWMDSAGQFSFLQPEQGETAAQVAARKAREEAAARHEAEQAEGGAILDELAAGTVLN